MAERPDRQVLHRSFVSYIDKSREFYAAHGYEQPYRWAAFDDVPFTPLANPLVRSTIAVVTTSFPHDVLGDRKKSVQSQPFDRPPDLMFTDDLSWDKDATHTDDTETFLPLARLEEFSAAGRIGELHGRFYTVPTEYSQRRTARDAESVLEWCKEDNIDAVVLVPL